QLRAGAVRRRPRRSIGSRGLGRCGLRCAPPARPGTSASAADNRRHARADGCGRADAARHGGGGAVTIERVAIIGLGLLGGSVGLAIAGHLPEVKPTGYGAAPAVRARAAERGLVGTVSETAHEAVAAADLVLFCVPVGAMAHAAAAIADHLPEHAIVSDVGSSKQSVMGALREALPGRIVIPAHPVAGTEQSGPDAGFASLFRHRWCILTPPADADPT